jgi:hypothetical protein
MALTIESRLGESANILRDPIDSLDFSCASTTCSRSASGRWCRTQHLSEKKAAVELQAKWGIFLPNARWHSLIAHTVNISEVLDKAFRDMEGQQHRVKACAERNAVWRQARGATLSLPRNNYSFTMKFENSIFDFHGV